MRKACGRQAGQLLSSAHYTQRQRICGYLKDEITRMARALPRHRVVPYRNIPKKDYPYNIPGEVNEP